jgi:hypothetical protein
MLLPITGKFQHGMPGGRRVVVCENGDTDEHMKQWSVITFLNA